MALPLMVVRRALLNVIERQPSLGRLGFLHVGPESAGWFLLAEVSPSDNGDNRGGREEVSRVITGELRNSKPISISTASHSVMLRPFVRGRREFTAAELAWLNGEGRLNVACVAEWGAEVE